MRAKEIMTRNPRTVTPEAHLTEVARLMKTEDVGIIARLADPYGAAFNIIELANEID